MMKWNSPWIQKSSAVTHTRLADYPEKRKQITLCRFDNTRKDVILCREGKSGCVWLIRSVCFNLRLRFPSQLRRIEHRAFLRKRRSLSYASGKFFNVKVKSVEKRNEAPWKIWVNCACWSKYHREFIIEITDCVGGPRNCTLPKTQLYRFS